MAYDVRHLTKDAHTHISTNAGMQHAPLSETCSYSEPGRGDLFLFYAACGYSHNENVTMNMSMHTSIDK